MEDKGKITQEVRVIRKMCKKFLQILSNWNSCHWVLWSLILLSSGLQSIPSSPSFQSRYPAVCKLLSPCQCCILTMLISTSVLTGLIMIVLKSNTLKFGERFFHQIKGTAMGTPMAVNFANLFMAKFETEMLADYKKNFKKLPTVCLVCIY